MFQVNFVCEKTKKMSSEVTTEQFSLRWNNFHTNLKSGFHDLLQQAEMVDVTLAVDGHFLQAHKVVLSICSPYFKMMFKANPCKHPIVILKDVGHENMKDILQFMYMGEVSVLKENLSSFLRTAEILQVKGLTGDDSGEDRLKKEDQKETTLEEENEMYSHLIETTSDADMAPPQTSPLPLNCAKKTTKSSLPTHSNKKLKTEYSSPYNLDSDTPKNVDYHSCDFTQVPDPEEAKDYSKNGPGVWKGGLPFNIPCHPDGSVLVTTKTEQNASEQGTSSFNKSDSRTAAVLKNGYQCEQCLKKFSRRDHLRTHEKNIHGSDAGPFKCVMCEQLYKNTESLRKHISKFHFTNLNDLIQQKVEVKG